MYKGSKIKGNFIKEVGTKSVNNKVYGLLVDGERSQILSRTTKTSNLD